jgi:uncharacterized protein (DUF934 family)
MPLINAKGADIADPAGLTLYPLAELPETLTGLAGVALPPNAELAAVLPRLGELAVIAVEFPKFRDGRGFSLARALREHHGYQGDIRATGHFLPDQFASLISCGFTSFQTPPEHAPAQFAAELAAPRQPGQLLRRSLARALERA